MGLQHNNYAEVQGFAPTVILTASAGVPLPVAGILALKPKDTVEYYINDDSDNKTDWAAQDVQVVDLKVTSFTFTTTVKLAVMYR